MRSITVSHTISMGHRLPSYNGICSSPHGHNVKVEVEFDTGPGFVDFKLLHAMLKEVLEPLDHAMVLESNDPLLDILRRMDFRTVTLHEEPSTENIALYIFKQLSRRNPPKIERVTVFETDKYSATVRP